MSIIKEKFPPNQDTNPNLQLYALASYQLRHSTTAPDSGVPRLNSRVRSAQTHAGDDKGERPTMGNTGF